MKKYFLWILLACGMHNTYAQPGTLDPGFNGNGIVIFEEPGTNTLNENVVDVLVQPGGGIVSIIATGSSLKMMRHLPDGTRDLSFGFNGVINVSMPFFPYLAVIPVDAELLPDGKILVVANEATENSGFRFALYRFNSNGTTDNSFGVNGKTTTDFTNQNDHATAMTLQPDGKILVVGFSFKSMMGGTVINNFAAARYLPNGAPDASFGGNGSILHDLGDFVYQATDVVVQFSGKIVVGGFTIWEDNQSFGLGRLNPDGSRDMSFGDAGLVYTDFGSNEKIAAIALQTDGKIVAAGTTGLNNTSKDFALARYNPDGSLDVTFSDDGMQVTDISSLFSGPTTNEMIHSLSIQLDGKLVVSGYTDHNMAGSNGSNFALARYLSNGTLDASFSGDGIELTTFFTNKDKALAQAIQADGKIVLAGYSLEASTGTDFLALARYNTNGTPDNTFSQDGQLLDFVPQPVAFANFNKVTVQPDGKVVAVGNSGFPLNGKPYKFAVARYNTDGTPHASFSNDGWTVTDFGGDQLANDVVLQPDGKIVVAGERFDHTTFNWDFIIVRYHTNGTVDQTFGNNGKVIIDLGKDELATSVVLQPDGKIVVAGSASNNSNTDIFLTRLLSNGSPDNSFGTNGKVVSDFGGQETATALALQQDGKIVVSGNDLVVRYNANGVLDNSFSDDGRQTINASNSLTTALTINSSGKLFIAGTTWNTQLRNDDFFIASLNPDGTPNLSFSEDGLQTTDFGHDDRASDIVLQPNGKLIVTGFTNNTNSNIALARYNPDGSLDQTFGRQGKTITDLGFDEAGKGLALFGNRLYVAGNIGETNHLGGLVAAYQVDNPPSVTSLNNNGANTITVAAAPNPSSNVFTMQLNDITTETLVIQVADANGRIIERKVTAATNTLQLGSDYQPGIYFVTIIQGKKQQVVQLIKK